MIAASRSVAPLSLRNLTARHLRRGSTLLRRQTRHTSDACQEIQLGQCHACYIVAPKVLVLLASSIRRSLAAALHQTDQGLGKSEARPRFLLRDTPTHPHAAPNTAACLSSWSKRCCVYHTQCPFPHDTERTARPSPCPSGSIEMRGSGESANPGSVIFRKPRHPICSVKLDVS